MTRKANNLISLGISMALIAGGILLLSNHAGNFAHGRSEAFMPHAMASGAAGTAPIVIMFWIAAISAFVLVASGVFAEHRAALGEKPQKPSESPGSGPLS
jgi:divalent metal cation (Fe/Co/Zn/Cd) transporter